MTSNIIESCLEINERDQNALRASFQGLIQAAPSGTSTSIVNGLSQQLIYQLQLLMPNAFVSFDDLNVDLSDAGVFCTTPQKGIVHSKTVESHHGLPPFYERRE